MLIGLGGCSTIHRNEAKYERDMLVAAGFDVKPADSPERVQELHAMPPLKIVPQEKDGDLEYRLADPYLCQCLYVGDASAYENYQRLVSDDFLDAVLSVPVR